MVEFGIGEREAALTTRPDTSGVRLLWNGKGTTQPDKQKRKAMLTVRAKAFTMCVATPNDDKLSDRGGTA